MIPRTAHLPRPETRSRGWLINPDLDWGLARDAVSEINAWLGEALGLFAGGPRILLALPAWFDPERTGHLTNLGVALTLIAPMLPGYGLEVCIDGEIQEGVFSRVAPLGPSALDQARFALCVLDRALADRLARRLPTRFVGSDPLPFFPDKWRLLFADPTKPKLQGSRWTPESLGQHPRPPRVLLLVDPFFAQEPFATLARAFAGFAGTLTLGLGTCQEDPRTPEITRCSGGRAGVHLPPLSGARLPDHDGFSDPSAAPRHAAADKPPPYPFCGEGHPEAVAGLQRAMGERLRLVPISRELFESASEHDFVLAFERAWLAAIDHPGRVQVDGSGACQLLSPGAALEVSDFVLYKGEEQDPAGVIDRILLPPSPGGALAPCRALTRPLISIVVPVYDRDQEIDRLVDSLAAQRYPYLEVVFVSNGSPGQTLDALRRGRVLLLSRGVETRLIQFPTAFGTATIPRDVGVYGSRGELICFLDSDDYLEPGFFDFFLENHARQDVVYCPKKIFRDLDRPVGGACVFDRELSSFGDLDEGFYERLILDGNLLNNSGVIVSRALFRAERGIPHTFQYCEDYYLWLRFAHVGAKARENPGAVDITLHPGNNAIQVQDDTWWFRAVQKSKEGIRF